MSDLENQHRGRYNSSSVSIIGEDAVYRGDIEFEGVLHVNGDFYGNIKGNGDLAVGLRGRVRSVAHVSNVIISGLVCGDVFALGRVAIKSSAIVVGDIQAATLVVEEGAILHGKLEILERKEQRRENKPSLLSPHNVMEAPKQENAATIAQAATEKMELKPAAEPKQEVPPQAQGAADSEDEAATKQKKVSRKGKYSVWN